MTDALDASDRLALTRWLRTRGVPGVLGPAHLLAGGTQNVVLEIEVDERPVVLRRPPVHPRANSNATLRREMRFLEALAGTDVPHPTLLHACPDPAVLGGDVFYLMERVEGFTPSIETTPQHAADPALRHGVGLAMAMTIGRLGSVDVDSVGLADLGRPGFLERQVPQWAAMLNGYASTPGYAPEQLPHARDVAAWLAENRPPAAAPGIVHGDFQLANVMIHRTRPDVAAVIDWELATVGDPLLDLGWLLVSWPGSTIAAMTPREGSLAAASGLATRRELIDAYEAVSDRDLTHVDWYVALAGFKFGVLVEGTWVRSLTGQAPREVGERLHRHAVGLMGVAHRVSRGWSVRS